MTAEQYDWLRDRIARILWDQYSPDQGKPQSERAPWRDGEWIEVANRIMKEVAAKISA